MSHSFEFKKPMPIGGHKQLQPPPPTSADIVIDTPQPPPSTTTAITTEQEDATEDDVLLKKTLTRRLDYFTLDKMLVVYRDENQFLMKRLEPLIEQFRQANPANASMVVQRDGKRARHVDAIVLYIVDMKNVKHRVKQYNISKRQAERTLKEMVLWRRWRQTVVRVSDVPPTLWHWITTAGYFVLPLDIKTFFPELQFTPLDLIVSSPLFNIKKRISDRGSSSSERAHYDERHDHSIFDDSQLVADVFELGGVSFDHYSLSALVYMCAIEFYTQHVTPFVSKLVAQLPPVVVRPSATTSVQTIKRAKALSSLDDLDEYEDDQQNESNEDDSLIAAASEKGCLTKSMMTTTARLLGGSDPIAFATLAASKTTPVVTNETLVSEDEDEYFNGGHTSDESEGENNSSKSSTTILVNDSGSDDGGGGGASSSEDDDNANNKKSTRKTKRSHHHHNNNNNNNNNNSSDDDSSDSAAYSSSEEEDPKPIARRQFSRIPATMIANQKKNALVIDSESILSLYDIARQTLLAQANRIVGRATVPPLIALDRLASAIQTCHHSAINVREWLEFLVRRLNEYIKQEALAMAAQTNGSSALEPILNVYQRLRTERRNFKQMTRESWFQLYKYERIDACEADVWGNKIWLSPTKSRTTTHSETLGPEYPPRDLANLSESRDTFVHLVFDRKQVPPLDLEESFHFFQRYYHRASGTSASFDFKIRWDVNSTRVSLPTNQYLALTRIVLPNLLSIHSRQIRIHRQVPFAVYHLQCEAFFSTQLGRFLTFKSILSSFKGSKLWRQSSTEGIYPKSCEEQAVYFFKHLPAILTNYGSGQDIWRTLVQPIKVAQMTHLQSTLSKPAAAAAYNAVNRSAKKIKTSKNTSASSPLASSTATSITNICIWQNSIYTALEAYYTAYCKHYMARETMLKLVDLFQYNPKMQGLFPQLVDIVWKMNEDNLTKKPRNFKTHSVSGTMEFVEIPYYSLSDEQEATFAKRDFHRDERNFTPLHMYLYELMAGLGRMGDTNRTFAIELFHSIRIINRNVLLPAKERVDAVLNDPSPVILKMKKKTLNALLSYNTYWSDISQYYANVTDPHSSSAIAAASANTSTIPVTTNNTLRLALFSLMQSLELLSFFTFDSAATTTTIAAAAKTHIGTAATTARRTTVEIMPTRITPGVAGNHTDLNSEEMLDQRFLNKKHIPIFAPDELESTPPLHDLIDIRTSKTYRPQTKDWHQYKIHPLTIYNALPIGRSDFNEDLEKQVVSQRCNIRHYLASNAFVFSQRDFLPCILMYPIALKDAARLLLQSNTTTAAATTRHKK